MYTYIYIYIYLYIYIYIYINSIVTCLRVLVGVAKNCFYYRCTNVIVSE